MLNDGVNYQLQMRRTLTDWVTGVFGIFWSIWWSFFINKIIEAEIPGTNFVFPFLTPNVVIEIPKTLFLVISTVSMAIFAVVFVQWLWRIHETTYAGILLNEFYDVSRWLALILFFLVSGFWASGFGYQISDNLIWYGTVLTPLWPTTVLVTIWRISLND